MTPAEILRRRLENQVKRLEQKMAELEKEEKVLQADLGNGSKGAATVEAGYNKLGEIAGRISAAMEEWEVASARLQQMIDQEA